MALEDWLSKMYEKVVVIHNKGGYHYGRLCGYDGKFLYLEGYYFSKKPMDYFERLTHSVFGKNAVLRVENIISIIETGLGEELLRHRRHSRFLDVV
jgi:hypothetical protein